MKTASAREVQHGFSRYLTEVSRGKSVLITKHGKEMARLVPARSGGGGRSEWPDFEARLRAVYGDGWEAAVSATEIVGEARGER